MFTAIVVAMLLIFHQRAGLLDFNLVWVPPTYLWPRHRRRPPHGRRLHHRRLLPRHVAVSAATLKIDGIFFVLGAFLSASFLRRDDPVLRRILQLLEFGPPDLARSVRRRRGVVVIAVTLMALVMFGVQSSLSASSAIRTRRLLLLAVRAAGAALAVALAVLILGQPTAEQRWQRIAAEKQPSSDQRAVQIHPGELLSLIEDPHLQVVMLDAHRNGLQPFSHPGCAPCSPQRCCRGDPGVA